jgi:K+-sensing histidine kinase KdpD
MLSDRDPSTAPGHMLDQPGQVVQTPSIEALASQLTTQTARLATLQELTAALSPTRTPEEIATVVLLHGASALGAVSGAVRLLSADGQWLIALPAPGYQPAVAIVNTHNALGAGLPHTEAARTGEPVWIESLRDALDRYAAVVPGAMALGIQAAAELPLLVEGRVIGELNFNFARPHTFAPPERDFLRTIASLTALALERAQLYVVQQERVRAAEELARLRQEQVTQAEALSAVSAALASTLEPEQIYALILDQCSRLLPYDHAAVLLHQDGWTTVAGSRGIVTVPIDTRVFRVSDIALVATIGAHGKPALIRDTATLKTWIEVPPFIGAQSIRSVIVVPLVVDGNVVGTFNVDSFTPGFYTEQHLAAAVVFAERVTQALRNARLYRVEQQRASAAEELARLRSNFVAAVSHELRSPLTAIIGFGELLLARWEQMAPQRRLERIALIVQSANRQKRLVEDLLLVSRLESANLAPRREMLSLAALTRQAALEAQSTYPGQRVIQQGPGNLHVYADAAHTIQVLTNLIDNAAKYSPEGSPITVRWAEIQDMAVVRVIDQGPGVPEEGRDHLFTRFGRLPGSAIRGGRVGTGLGLFISRGLAEAMSGSLDLEATGPGGTTFRLLLPRHAADAAPDAPMETCERGDALW